ncbi:right-handed parallel beta-helix repeat-containing protein [Paenibacillus sp. GCM10023252]|uniref:right-handed parallel beta-helix repeat-containing protein n=1 Tax=Paenibacillus sp. GCM10023252 TaxID=3252649 RepID=UPI00361F2D93
MLHIVFKRMSSGIIAALLLAASFPSAALAEPEAESNDSNPSGIVYYVSPTGNDANTGTISKPFATLEKAKQELKANKKNIPAPATVYIRGGTYSLSKPLVFDETDSGEEHSPITYKAYPGEKPVLTGGVEINPQWEPYKGYIYKTKVSGIEDMRELFANEKRQVRSRSAVTQGFAIPNDKRGFLVANADLPQGGIEHPEDLQYYQNIIWRTYILPVDKAQPYGKEYTNFRLREPYITTHLTKHNFAIGYNSMFWFENALEFVDSPGEWYFDKRTKELFYYPEKELNLEKAKFEVPQAKSLITISGSSVDKKVHHLKFEGLTLKHTSWLEVNTRGFSSAQGTTTVTDKGAFNELVPAAVNINNAHHIDLERNVLEQMGASAINAENGISDIRFLGNILSDLSGGGITLGRNDHIKIDQPSEELPRNIDMNNNVFREIGVDFMGSPGINTFYSENLNILHNDMDGMNYSGVSVGWGWSKTSTTLINTVVGYNKIQNFSRKTIDGGGIYSLSRHENSLYVGNYIKNANSPFNTAGLYHDAESRGFVNENNVVELERDDYSSYNLNQVDDIHIKNLYTTTGNIINFKPGPNVKIENVHIYPDAKWPKEAKEIINESGLQKEYRDILKKVRTFDYEEKPFIRSSGYDHVKSLFFEPRSPINNEKLWKAPHLEEQGIVIVDAKDYNEYQGLESSDYSFVGVLGWFNGFASKYTLKTHPKQMTRAESYPDGAPSLTYNVKFTTPGDYYFFLRGKADHPDGKIIAGFNGKTLGSITLPKDFAYVNLIDGIPVVVKVKEPGVHTITLTGTRGDIETFLDRLVLTKQPTDSIYDGSKSFGPQNSKKAGVQDILVPLPRPAIVFPQ